MKKTSRRSFFKKIAVAAGALAIMPKALIGWHKPKIKRFDARIYGATKVRFNSTDYAVVGIKPLEGVGVSGDSIMSGNEEMPLFYDE